MGIYYLGIIGNIKKPSSIFVLENMNPRDVVFDGIEGNVKFHCLQISEQMYNLLNKLIETCRDNKRLTSRLSGIATEFHKFNECDELDIIRFLKVSNALIELTIKYPDSSYLKNAKKEYKNTKNPYIKLALQKVILPEFELEAYL